MVVVQPVTTQGEGGEERQSCHVIKMKTSCQKRNAVVVVRPAVRDGASYAEKPATGIACGAPPCFSAPGRPHPGPHPQPRPGDWLCRPEIARLWGSSFVLHMGSWLGQHLSSEPGGA